MKHLLTSTLTTAAFLGGYHLSQKPNLKIQPQYCMIREDQKMEVGVILERGLQLRAIGKFHPEKCQAQDRSGPPEDMHCNYFTE